MAFLQALQAAQRGGLTPNAQLTASREFNKFLQENNLAYDSESSIAWLMVEACDTAMGANSNYPRVSNDEAHLCARRTPAAPAAGAAAGAPPAQGALFNLDAGGNHPLMMGIPPAAFRLLVQDAGKALFWLLDLVACHQVKPLNAGNIRNYFRAGSRVNVTGREIMKVIDFAAVTLGRVMDTPALVAMLDDSKFMDYHTSYSSSGKLAEEMISCAPALTHALFTDETRAAITTSANNPSSRENNEAIPEQALLATHAYLSAFGKLPEGWFQGERARSSLPASKYNVYLALFRRLRVLSSNVDALEAATDIAGLIASVAADMLGV